MLNIDAKRLETVLQDREELAPAMPEGHHIESIQLHNEEGIVISLPIKTWYSFTLEMRGRINSGTPPTFSDLFIADIISSIRWVEYVTKDEDGLTRLVVPTWSL